MNKNRVICCGELLFDLITHDNKGTGSHLFEAFPGGSSANTAMVLSRLGARVHLLSHLGKDFLSDILIDKISKAGIKTDLVIRDKRACAPLAIARVDDKGNPSYRFYSVDLPVRPPSRGKLLSHIKTSCVFHTGSFFSYSDTAFPLVLDLVRMASRAGVFVTYDPNWRPHKILNKTKARRRIKELLSYVDLIKLSEEDARHLADDSSVPGSVRKISRSLKGSMVLTRGEKGAVFYGEEKILRQPAVKTIVKNTIGAGDSFMAAMIYRIQLLGRKGFLNNMKDNLLFATSVSALACTAKGASDGIKSRAQIERFIRKNRSSGLS